ncbi:MAG: CcdB family protein [Propionivibrio sp.]
MTQYGVYKNPEGNGYVLDVQADVNSHFNTRLVVPLLPVDIAPKPAKTLNPLFELDGAQYSMVTQYMAAMPVKVLKDKLFNVTERRAEIVAAIDLLLQGF